MTGAELLKMCCLYQGRKELLFVDNCKDLDSKLCFRDHTAKVITESYRSLGFLKRNTFYFNERTKMVVSIYLFVLSLNILCLFEIPIAVLILMK